MRDARRAAAAHLQRGRGAAERLPRGPRVPARGAARRSTRRRSRSAGSRPRASSPTRSSTRFADPERGGFFSTSDDHEPLVARRKDLEDAPIPSGGSAAAFGLLRLAALTGEARYEEHAVAHLRLLHEIAPRHPTAFGHLLQALDFHLAPVREVALAGEPAGVARARGRGAVRVPPARRARGRRGRRRLGVPLLEGRAPVDGRAAAYVCEHFACLRPVTAPDELRALLDRPEPAVRAALRRRSAHHLPRVTSGTCHRLSRWHGHG